MTYRTRTELILALAVVSIVGCHQQTEVGDNRPDASESDSACRDHEAGPPSDTGPVPDPDGGPPLDSGNPSRLESPPPRPNVDDSGGGPGQIVFALKDTLLEQGREASTIGFDLDGRDTKPPFEGASGPPCASIAGDSVEADGERGIDNTFGQEFFQTISFALPNLEKNTNIAQTAGRGTPLLLVREWNGNPNDPQLEAALAQAVAGASSTSGAPTVTFPEGGDNPQLPDGGTPIPCWHNCDSGFSYNDELDCRECAAGETTYWWPRDDVFNTSQLDSATIVDNAAYMTDRQLVMDLPPNTTILFFAGEKAFEMRLTDGTLVGTVSDTMQRIADVTVAGRWSISSLMQNASNVDICPCSSADGITDEALRKLSDIPSNPENDNAGRSITCDALSIAIKLQNGTRGNLADLAPSPSIPDPCEGVDNCPDGTCNLETGTCE